MPGQANGGYSLALCLQALRAVLPHPDPLVVSATYLRPVRVGPARLTADPVRAGRRLATGEARLLQEGKECVRVLGTFTDLDALSGPTHVEASPPELPAPEDCVSLADGPNFGGSTIIERVEFRAAAAPGFLSGNTAGPTRFEFWMRMAGVPQLSSLQLACLVDMAPPAIYELGLFTTTSVELTVHVRRRPAPGWLACRVSTRFLMDGLHDEDFEVWDSTGSLVAQSRQLQMLL